MVRILGCFLQEVKKHLLCLIGIIIFISGLNIIIAHRNANAVNNIIWEYLTIGFVNEYNRKLITNIIYNNEVTNSSLYTFPNRLAVFFTYIIGLFFVILIAFGIWKEKEIERLKNTDTVSFVIFLRFSVILFITLFYRFSLTLSYYLAFLFLTAKLDLYGLENLNFRFDFDMRLQQIIFWFLFFIVVFGLIMWFMLLPFSGKIIMFTIFFPAVIFFIIQAILFPRILTWTVLIIIGSTCYYKSVYLLKNKL